ncbi:MAG: hypothetical protein EOO50_04360 [Flavobacterium sp.]|uniref:hypothetical protein n=1 Tax=Flavobacterium sp. TaxID=239 RepID=UPI0011F85BFB|nr:hypothetical protein [Flavobacterium sp.]RZJ67815.1 MAG: hypothetical protein EOO50_04360 [Flavobacterium sp.]
MDTTHNKDLGSKTWNNDQQKGDLNEGFSGENIPDDYNPAKHVKERETDAQGNSRFVDRARDAHMTSDGERGWSESESLSRANEIYDEKADGKEDHNYDDAQRYSSPSHRDNHENRGNMELDE